MPTSIIDARDEDVFLVTTRAAELDSGMIATWIVQASMSTQRPRLAAIMSPRNRTTELIELSGRFVVQLLAEDQFELVPSFGLHSSRDSDKFHGIELSRTPSNLPVVAGTKGWVECLVASKIYADDRILYVADIVARSPVQTHVRGLRMSEAISRLPRDVVQALSKQREETMQLDDAIVRGLQR